MTDSRHINIIAPALRVLLGGAGLPKLVRFEPDGGGTAVDLPDGADDPRVLVEHLRRILSSADSPEAIAVAGVGTFHISDPPGRGRAAGKIAVVTGAAQGFGLEIAQHLAAEGATVALADVNENGAAGAAAKLCEQHGPGRAMGLGVDVTDGKSVEAAFGRVVRGFGGLDLLVSNAGVLRAQSVKTQPQEDFDLVTAVNYRGYFLCVQKAAPILAVGHMASAGYTSDIIQINSKSGLAGSNRNGAYAGSKFGGIGLTQSFAMELIEDGVKVNAICPGNFFDGPLWSDPENGLFVQYLKAGKIPGAKTIQDVRDGYEAKIPMGRGCTTADVMKALFYLIEQTYETGQALPVTGGQVMLK